MTGCVARMEWSLSLVVLTCRVPGVSCCCVDMSCARSELLCLLLCVCFCCFCLMFVEYILVSLPLK